MIVEGLANAYKLAIVRGVHQPGDDYRLALYASVANLDKDTAAYTPTGEVAGAGYVAGGASLAGFAAALDGDVAVLDFANPSWPNSTITARGGLIYNATRGNAAVAILDFGHDVTSTSGPFTVSLPDPTAANAIVRVGP